ncbi:MAG: ZIP family metal transporter [Dethiobacteria bacterium]|jgi:ZIP family zinc transporter|nr:ZIP family metal transporter [Bacillota bacterium]
MEIDFLVEVTLLGLFAGVIGTGSGGMLSLLFRKPHRTTLSLILGLSAGIMLVVIFLELLQEAFEIGGRSQGILGLTLGILVLWFLDIIFPHLHLIFREGEGARYLKAGVLLGIGIALHNIPEGLAIGAGYASTTELGNGLALIMAVHNIPEGVAMATTMLIGKARPWKVMAATFLAGLPMGIGAWIGGYVGSISSTFLSLSLGFAAGAMLYIVCDELIPDAHTFAEEGHYATLGIVGGVLIGLLIGILP